MIRKIRNRLVLQLICIVLAILAILSVTLYTSFEYVRETTGNSAVTLAESLLIQSAISSVRRRQAVRRYGSMIGKRDFTRTPEASGTGR